MSYDQTDQDQLYIEDGYFTPDGYYVYIAEAKVDLTPYIDEGYIEANYYEYYGGAGTFTCDFDVVAGGQIEEANANLTATASISAQIAITKVADSAISAVASQTATIFRIQEGASTVSAQASQSTVAVKTVSADINAGALFTPNITVEAVKNMTAVIDCVATISADTQATKVFNITLSTIVTQSLQGVYTVNAHASIASAFSSTANTDVVKEYSSNQSSAFNLTINAGKLILVSSTQSAVAATSISKYFGSGRPRNIYEGATTFNSSIKKFGSHSLQSPTWARSEPLINGTSTVRPKSTQPFVMEAWIYLTSYGTGSNDGFGVGLNRLNSDSWIRITTNGTLEFSSGVTDAGNPPATAANAVALNSWHHILVVANPYTGNNNDVSVYVNGTRVAQHRRAAPNFTQLADYFSIRTGITYIDDVSFHVGSTLGYNPSSTTITVPTSARENDFDYTRLLWHMDNNGLDDVSIINRATANISTTSTVSTNARTSKVGASSLSSTATQSTQSIKTARTGAELQAQGFAVTAVGRIQSSVADLDSQFALSATAGLNRTAQATLTATTTLTAQGQDLDLASAALTATTTLTAEGRFFRKGGVANVTATATLTANVTEISTPDTLVVDNTRALFHLNTLPAVNVYSSSLSINTNNATVSSGKFSNSLDIDPRTGKYLTSTIGFSLEGGVNFVYDFWWRDQGDAPDFGSTDTVIASVGSTVNNGGNVRYPNGGPAGPVSASINRYSTSYHGLGSQDWGLQNGTIYINWPYNSTFDPSDYESGLIANYQLTDTNWHHFLYSRTRIDSETATYRLFIDGVKVIEYVGYYSLSTNNSSFNINSGVVSERLAQLDEFRLVKGITQTSNFTSPTEPYFPPNPFYYRNFNALLETTSNFSVDFLRVNFGNAALESNSQIQTTAVKTSRTGSTINAACNLTVNATKAVNAQISVLSTVTQTASAVKTTDITVDSNIIATQLSDVRRLRDFEISSTTASTLSIEISKFAGIQAVLASEFAHTVEYTRIRPAEIATDSIATQLTVAAKNATGTVLLESSFAQQTTAVKTTDILAQPSAEFAQSAQAQSTVFAQANISADSTQTTVATKFRPAQANVTSSFAINIDAVKTTNVISNNSAEFTQTTVNDRLRDNTVTVSSAFTQNTEGLRVKIFTVSANSNSEILATAFTLVQYQANIASNGFVLAAGDVEHIDPYYTYMIEQETRAFQIDEEPRLYTIDPETRVNIIKGSLL